MWTTPHRPDTRTLAMETNRTVAERELAKLNEVSALDARRTHHRLVELLTAMVGDARGAKGVRGLGLTRQAGPIPPNAVRASGATWTQHAVRPTGGITPWP
jgi:hypothetical protein